MSDLETILKGLEQEVRDRAAADFADTYERVGAFCESPIEKLLLAALIVERIEGIDIRASSALVSADALWCQRGVPWAGAIYPQVVLGKYRADFYLEAVDHERNVWLRLAIECDGHEFHEKTKDQAARDKRRDRWLQTHGVSVMRFTGAEIWRDPLSCADQIVEFFFAAENRAKP